MKSLVFSLLALTAAVSAAPQWPQPKPPQTQPVQVTQDLLQKFNVYSQFAAASYCPHNIAPTPQMQQLACSQYGGKCPFVESRDTRILTGFQDNSTYSAGGYLAVDNMNKTLMLAFRGRVGYDGLTKIPEELTQCKEICPWCRCWTTYYSSWTALRVPVLAAVSSARKRYPTYPLVVTGHSFGGVLASYAAAEIRKTASPYSNATTSLFTFGAPRGGDFITAATITNQGSNYRVTHTDDPAPSLGDTENEFRHFSPEHWIYHDNTDNSVGVNMISVIDGYDSTKGNLGASNPNPGVDTAAHIEYFMCNIQSCYNSTQRCDSFLEMVDGELQNVRSYRLD